MNGLTLEHTLSLSVNALIWSSTQFSFPFALLGSSVFHRLESEGRKLPSLHTNWPSVAESLAPSQTVPTPGEKQKW